MNKSGPYYKEVSMGTALARWMGRQLQSRLREDRHLLGAISQPHLPACLWTIVCDYTCEDPRVVDVMLELVWIADIADDDIYKMITHDEEDGHIMYGEYSYQSNELIRHDVYNHEVFDLLLMLPPAKELNVLDVEMRRVLYAAIK